MPPPPPMPSFSFSLSLVFLCLPVSRFLFFSLSFSPPLFSLSRCFLSLCVSVFPFCCACLFSVLLCFCSLCLSVFSFSFFPPPLWFLCLSVSSVFVCCLLAFCLGCPAVLRGATTKLRISFSGSIYYASGGCGSIMLPPSPFTL